MKFKSTLIALATGLGLLAAGSANAINLGEFYVTDQTNGTLYVYKQSKLNSRFGPADSDPATHDLKAITAAVSAVNPDVDPLTVNATTGASGRNHLIGFNNRKGLSSKSRMLLAYLDGDFQVWETNGGPGGTVKLVFGENVGASANSLHMCGPNPQGDQVACSSIGGLELVFYDVNFPSNTYDRIANIDLADLTIEGSLAPALKAEIQAELDTGMLAGRPICNNYDTSGTLLYVTINTGGVLILDASDPANGTPILGADELNSATGCGLVNTPDGKFMWTNEGSNTTADDEAAHKWKFSDAGVSNGPAASVDIPEDDNGDVHGAQFAGPSIFLWELMRLDHKIHVIKNSTATLVNSFSIATNSLDNPAGDVLDRSALGGFMYATLRGAVPITAITGFTDPDRDPGVMTIRSRWWGYTGKVRKVSSIRSGIMIPLGNVMVDNADPHGGKSLSYLTGGF